MLSSYLLLVFSIYYLLYLSYMYIMHTLHVCMYIYPKLQYKCAYSCSINMVDAYRYHAIGSLPPQMESLG